MRQHIAHGIWPTVHAVAGTLALPFAGRPTLVTLFWGANDSTLPDGDARSAAVDSEQYRRNLIELITMLKGASGCVNDQLRVIVISPPQTDGDWWGQVSQQRWNLPKPPRTRALAFTQPYVEAARAAAGHHASPHVAFVDAWSITSDTKAMLCDGLHLSARGNRELFHAVINCVKQRWPELLPESRPLDGFPHLHLLGAPDQPPRPPASLAEVEEVFAQHASSLRLQGIRDADPERSLPPPAAPS